MNNYITKLIPKKNGFHRTIKNTQGIPYDFEYEVELALCSHNFKVGDKVSLITRGLRLLAEDEVVSKIENNYVFVESDKWITPLGETDWHMAYPIDDVFKVIGIVKKELQLTENMEFFGDDIIKTLIE